MPWNEQYNQWTIKYSAIDDDHWISECQLETAEYRIGVLNLLTGFKPPPKLG